MESKGMNLNEIYAFFDTMPQFCPVCGEQLYYGVSIYPRYDYVTIFISCGSGSVYTDFIRHDCIEKRDLEYLMFKLCNDPHGS